MAKIIAVDDQPQILKIIKVKLEKEGHSVITVSNSLEAFDTVKKEKPDVVLLDIVMPSKSGIEILKDIKGDPDLSDVKVVMLSANNEQENIDTARDSGADGFIFKPFSPRDLALFLKDLVSQDSK